MHFLVSQGVDLLIVTHAYSEKVFSWVDKVRESIRGNRVNIQGAFKDMPRIFVVRSVKVAVKQRVGCA